MTSAVDTVNYGWRIEQGEREALDVPVLDNGVPRVVTGWTIDAVIKDAPGGTVLYTFPPAQVVINEHIIQLIVPATVSAAWTWTVGWWRVKITAPDTDPADPETYRVAQGAFLVDRD